MNILVTGGNGFIGSHLIKKLLLDKHQIIILERKNSSHSRLIDVQNKLIFYASENFNIFKKIFKLHKIDLIIHLATCYIKSNPSQEEIETMLHSNIVLPTMLLNSAIEHKVKGFINTGTCFEYKLSDHPLDEKAPVRAYNFYAATKLAFEQLLTQYAQNKKIKALTLKLFYPYGEQDNPKLINHIISSIFHKKDIKLNNGNAELNFTYIQDIITAYLKAINFINSKKYHDYEIFNIGSKQAYSIKEIAQTLKKIARSNINIQYKNNSDGINYMNCNYQKAKKMLNWEPTHSLKKGLTNTFQYYLKNKELSQ